MKKIIKLSLAATLATTAMNAAAVDNVKLSGNAKLFYETHDDKNAMFSASDTPDTKGSSKGQVLISVKGSASIGPVTANVRHSTLTTLGLEHTIVSAPQVGTNETAGTINYVDIANLTYKINDTTIISGRQELNTPLCFTEKWNVTSNTFNANVLVNTGLIPGMTFIVADVKTTNAKGNGILATEEVDPINPRAPRRIVPVNGAALNSKGNFDRVIDTSLFAMSTKISSVDLNYYYYDINLNDYELSASAAWFDTTYNVSKDTKVKALYTEIDVDTNNYDTIHAYAFSASAKVAGVTIFGAYSRVSDTPTNNDINFCNVATNKKSKLPTQAVYVDGTLVAKQDAESFKIKFSGLEVANTKFALQYVTTASQPTQLDGSVKDKQTHDEVDFIVSTKIGAIGIKTLLMRVNKSNEDHVTHKFEQSPDTKFRVITNYSF
jgi:hypothetical protein